MRPSYGEGPVTGTGEIKPTQPPAMWQGSSSLYSHVGEECCHRVGFKFGYSYMSTCVRGLTPQQHIPLHVSVLRLTRETPPELVTPLFSGNQKQVSFFQSLVALQKGVRGWVVEICRFCLHSHMPPNSQVPKIYLPQTAAVFHPWRYAAGCPDGLEQAAELVVE